MDNSGEGQATAVEMEYYEESRPIVKEDLEDDLEDPSARDDIHHSDQDCSEDVPGDRERGRLENSTNSLSGESASHTQTTLESGLGADGEGVGREDVGADVDEHGQQGTAHVGVNVQGDAGPCPHRCDLCGLTFPSVNVFQAHLQTHSKSLGVSAEDSETDDSESDDTEGCENDASLSERDVDENDSDKQSSSDNKRKRKRSPVDEATKVDEASGSAIGREQLSDDSVDSDVEAEGGSGAHQCDICGNKYKYARGLKSHLVVHSGTKDHKCDICKKAFVKRDTFLRHRREVHFKVKCKTSGENAKFICDLCGKGFPVRDRLRKHKQHHTEKRPYKCDVCDRAFVLNGDLTKHYMTHTQERPHKCTMCNKKFARNSNLKKHLRIHTGEKPYSCDFCGESFARRDVLLLHEREHSGEFSFKCDGCGAVFTQKVNLVNHLKAGNCHEKRIVRIRRAGRRKRGAKVAT